jgi:hypothetical protein
MHLCRTQPPPSKLFPVDFPPFIICYLFNNAASSSDCITLNGGMIDWGRRRKWSWPSLGYYTGTFQEELMKTIKTPLRTWGLRSDIWTRDPLPSGIQRRSATLNDPLFHSTESNFWSWRKRDQVTGHIITFKAQWLPYVQRVKTFRSWSLCSQSIFLPSCGSYDQQRLFGFNL